MKKEAGFSTKLCDRLTEKELEKIEKNMNQIVFQNRELLLKHNPFDQEKREISAIQNGSLRDLKESWQETYSGQIGKLADDPLRQAKNHAIVLVTLASRAAMNGGLLPEIGFSLSDVYIQKIEKEKNPEAAFLLGRQAEYHYTALVSRIRNAIEEKQSEDPRIEEIKSYIFTHLHEKLRIEELADHLFLNKTYLCGFFKKETGVTIGEYISLQKIQAVRNMLIYSEYSYSEIASYFGYSSQSHLGQQFKRTMGMTLREYRMKYQRATWDDNQNRSDKKEERQNAKITDAFQFPNHPSYYIP